MKDTTQQLMDEVYDFWNLTEENQQKRKNEILQYFSTAHRMAVRFGKFNQQVENGGISQWIGNQYMAEDMEELLEFASMGVNWEIEGMKRFRHALEGIVDALDGWEEETEEECCICNGEGEVENEDEDEEGEYVSCDECCGMGTVTVDHPYPSQFEFLENQYYAWDEDEKFAVLNQFLERQLLEQEKERQVVTISLNRGTETIVAVEENPNTNVIHVLDLDTPEATSLTNAIEEVQAYLYKQYPSTRDMYFYHTDGYVTEYKDGNFHPVAEKDKRIYRPFFLQIPEVQMN